LIIKWNKSANFSKKLINVVEQQTRQLAEAPIIYTKADFNEARVASMGDCRIFSMMHNDETLIPAFWDNRQDPNRLLRILQGDK